MKNKKELIKSSAYWFEKTQNEFYRQFYNYMQEQNISQNEMAEMLNVTKGYISQILNGNFNPTLKKLIELSIAIQRVPDINYKTFEEIMQPNSYKEIMIGAYLKTFNNCFFHSDSVNMIEIDPQKDQEMTLNKIESKYENKFENITTTSFN